MVSMIKVYQHISCLTQLTRELTILSANLANLHQNSRVTARAPATLITHHRLNAAEKSFQNSEKLLFLLAGISSANYC